MNELLDLSPKRWHLIISPSTTRLLTAIAYLAHRMELTVLDCGRRFDSSVVARVARGRREVIDNIKIQRAFTCYEAAKLIEQLPNEKKPVLILDFLSTFQDENVKLQSRKFLLEKSIQHFRRLSYRVGLAVCLSLAPETDNSVYLFERLQSVAPHVSVYDPMENKPSQMRFF